MMRQIGVMKCKLECRETLSEIQVHIEATSTPASSTKLTLEYSIVRDHSNHFIHDFMPCSKLT